MPATISRQPARTRRTHRERLFDDIDTIYQKMDDLYAIAKIRQSELDFSEGRVMKYTSVKELIHDLAN